MHGLARAVNAGAVGFVDGATMMNRELISHG